MPQLYYWDTIIAVSYKSPKIIYMVFHGGLSLDWNSYAHHKNDQQSLKSWKSSDLNRLKFGYECVVVPIGVW